MHDGDITQHLTHQRFDGLDAAELDVAGGVGAATDVQDALQYLCLGILRTTDITGAEPDPFEDSAAALRSQINGGRRYSGY